MSAIIPDENGHLHYYRFQEISKGEYDELNPTAVDRQTEVKESQESLMKLTVVKLKAIAKEKGVKASGKKADIVSRLLQGVAKPSWKNNERYATIYVISLNIDPWDEEYEGEEPDQEIIDLLADVENDELTSRNLLKEILRQDKLDLKDVHNGDMVEITNYSGYRSSGVYMLRKNGKKIDLINLDNDIDDYGSPSEDFKFPEFTPLYWDYKKMHVVGNKPNSYWHSGADEWLPVYVDPVYKPVWYGVQGVPYYGVYGNYIVLSSITKDTKANTKVSKITKRVKPPQSVIYINAHGAYYGSYPFIKVLTKKYKDKEFYGDTNLWI